MTIFLAAISLGFLGSFHCIGMCGPIALSLPIGNATPLKRFLFVLSYNSGRILTYSLFGALFGLIGKGFAIGGLQQALSVSLGLLLLLFVLMPRDFILKNKLNTGTFRFFSIVKNSLSKLFLKSGHKSLFLIGALNGLLPCGLVYMGIAAATATGDMLKGAAFMAVFGLGTVPVMLSLPLFGSVIGLPLRNTIRKTMPVVVGLMAVLLILRGLNLGIPYISPKIQANNTPACHSGNAIYPKKAILCFGPNSHRKK